jgi:hypothetical protein
MNADVLLREFKIIQNGTSLSSCPGLLVVNWMPGGETHYAEPGGKKLELTDNQTVSIPDDYRNQFFLRAEVTGKSWLEVQIISLHNYGLIGKMVTELAAFAGKKLPFGGSWLEKFSDAVKAGSPQIIAAGRSAVFSVGQGARQVTVELAAPADIYGEMLSHEQAPHPGEEARGDRELLMKKGSPNGSITFTVGSAD